MASHRSPAPDRLAHHFMRLPRELRDVIYAYVVIQESPINLADTTTELNITHPVFSAELLEACYTHNTFTVAFSDPEHIRKGRAPIATWDAHSQYKQFIRNLVVNATEVELWHTQVLDIERECTVWRPEVRKDWNSLLELPHLQRLTVNLQKHDPNIFSWANFSPILHQLRENLPKLRITFNVSFDDLLESLWYNEVWAVAGQMIADEYKQMGYVGVSELIERPSEEDKVYVEKYLMEELETRGRDAVQGLLAESPAGRRVLAPHYVVKEPALLRVLMEKQWEVYKQNQKE